MTGVLPMRQRPVLLLIAIALVASCSNDGESSPATTTTTNAGRGRIAVALTLTGGPGSGLYRQDDTIGAACGAMTGQRFAIAQSGEVTVRDQNNTIVGLAPLAAGVLTYVESSPGFELVRMDCRFSFDVDLEDRPTFLTFELRWTGSSATFDAQADVDEVRAGKLEITKRLG